MRSTPFGFGLGFAFSLLAAAGLAAGEPIETVAGFDAGTGPAGRAVRGVFAGAGMALSPRVAASLVLARADDSVAGTTNALATGLGVAVVPAVRLRVRLARTLPGGTAPGFLRLQAGPEFGRLDAARLATFYVIEATDAGERSHGARVEALAPLDSRFTARGHAAWATVPRAPAALEAALGLGFAPVRQIELVGELGLARGVTLSQGPLDRLLGDPPPESAGTETNASRIASVGVRVTLP